MQKKLLKTGEGSTKGLRSHLASMHKIRSTPSSGETSSSSSLPSYSSSTITTIEQPFLKKQKKTDYITVAHKRDELSVVFAQMTRYRRIILFSKRSPTRNDTYYESEIGL